MAYSDRELLARLIECEAGGEGDTGMRAVASVVMNRVNAVGGEYARVGQGSIRRIIMQPGQFVCASETENGVYNPQNIYNMRPTDIHYDIADWAIAGNRLRDVADSLWFYNPFSANCRPNFPSNVGYLQTRIGDHCFYNPTDAYYKT
ncbi:MAG: cell wall hydrolase [Ruminococcaceae bacterium]|nr:cell wall hydrolase [Oscillospiraceae bacterium]